MYNIIPGKCNVYYLVLMTAIWTSVAQFYRQHFYHSNPTALQKTMIYFLSMNTVVYAQLRLTIEKGDNCLFNLRNVVYNLFS